MSRIQALVLVAVVMLAVFAVGQDDGATVGGPAVTIGSSTQEQPAQHPLNMYAAGVSYNVGASPAIAGTGLYARRIADEGTYSFSVMDILPNAEDPGTVTTNIATGLAQKVFSIGAVPVYIPAAGGVSINGSNTGWAWTTGALASIRIRDNFRLMPNVRVVKSSVANGDGYRPVLGILVGWGQ